MSDSNEKYFDLHINGIGYLNRARVVSPKRADPFLAVDVTALYGSSDDVQKTRFDCRVVGGVAKEVIEQFMPQINDQGRMASDGTTLRHKVLAGFRLGDLYADTFTYQKGKKEGEIGVSLKARLLRLDWVKVDGNFVYQANIDTSESKSESEHVTAQTNTGDNKDELQAVPPVEVSRSKNDSDFEDCETELKNKSHHFDSQSKVRSYSKAV
ncbi:MAG: DUF3577 domain-containing protein [Candidatus Thiodiazotropha sp.]